MTHVSHTLNSSIYRPKKLPRVIRRQWPVLKTTALFLLIGIFAAAVTWRKVSFERSELQVALQRTNMESLDKAILHLKGQVEIESSYPAVADWARQAHGWRPIQDRVYTITVNANQLSNAALHEAKVLEAIHE
jgi:hypothetical protein